MKVSAAEFDITFGINSRQKPHVISKSILGMHQELVDSSVPPEMQILVENSLLANPTFRKYSILPEPKFYVRYVDTKPH